MLTHTPFHTGATPLVDLRAPAGVRENHLETLGIASKPLLGGPVRRWAGSVRVVSLSTGEQPSHSTGCRPDFAVAEGAGGDAVREREPGDDALGRRPVECAPDATGGSEPVFLCGECWWNVRERLRRGVV